MNKKSSNESAQGPASLDDQPYTNIYLIDNMGVFHDGVVGVHSVWKKPSVYS